MKPLGWMNKNMWSNIDFHAIILSPIGIKRRFSPTTDKQQKNALCFESVLFEMNMQGSITDVNFYLWFVKAHHLRALNLWENPSVLIPGSCWHQKFHFLFFDVYWEAVFQRALQKGHHRQTPSVLILNDHSTTELYLLTQWGLFIQILLLLLRKVWMHHLAQMALWLHFFFFCGRLFHIPPILALKAIPTVQCELFAVAATSPAQRVPCLQSDKHFSK